MKVIPTLEEHAFLSKAVVCSTGLLPCFVLRRLHIRNEKGCSPCVSSSARRLSPPPPHSLAPRPLLLSIPGTSPGGVPALFALLGAGILFHLSELSGPPCAMYRGSGP